MMEAVGIWVLRHSGGHVQEALLLRRATSPHRGEWFTVDGMLEPGEAPRSAALRELAEETSIDPVLLLGNGCTPTCLETPRGTVRLHAFVAFARDDASVVLNAEHSEWRWCSIEKALALVPLLSQRRYLECAVERMKAGSAEGILEATGADDITHPGGTLRAHLERTAALLRKFGACEVLQTAGLLHAAYGTDGFERSLLRLEDRTLLRALVGEEVERTVHLYAACDRKYLYANLNLGLPKYRDRFDGTRRTLTEKETRDFVELTFANELDIARQDGSFWKDGGAPLVGLFRGCKKWASESAYAYFNELLRESDARE